ncbi:MAG: methyltransferase domain-containing protein [Acidobacteriaceae bacterium]|nr:methyltransferase domain-containing protein [Acidobacteriaceae bacterium]
MSTVCQLARTFYPDLEGRWDDTLFRDAVLRFLRPGHRLLDLGAGRGAVPQMNFSGLVDEACGLDPTSEVLENPFLDSAKVGTAENIPWPDEYFDVVICNNVLEHLPDPCAAFVEIKRVLKKGGVFAAKTPNRFHYVPLISSLTPYRFHRWFHKSQGNDPEDIFPTQYRANSRRKLYRLATESGLEAISIRTFEGRPEYLRWNPLAYLMGVAYERLISSTEALADLRVILLATFRKPE